MPILDKNLLLAEIEERLNNYIPANTTRQIINDAAEVMTRYEVTRLKPDDGSDDYFTYGTAVYPYPNKKIETE